GVECCLGIALIRVGRISRVDALRRIEIVSPGAESYVVCGDLVLDTHEVRGVARRLQRFRKDGGNELPAKVDLVRLQHPELLVLIRCQPGCCPVGDDRYDTFDASRGTRLNRADPSPRNRGLHRIQVRRTLNALLERVRRRSHDLDLAVHALEIGSDSVCLEHVALLSACAEPFGPATAVQNYAGRFCHHCTPAVRPRKTMHNVLRAKGILNALCSSGLASVSSACAARRSVSSVAGAPRMMASARRAR